MKFQVNFAAGRPISFLGFLVNFFKGFFCWEIEKIISDFPSPCPLPRGEGFLFARLLVSPGLFGLFGSHYSESLASKSTRPEFFCAVWVLGGW
jgi:hypothetical protein